MCLRCIKVDRCAFKTKKLNTSKTRDTCTPMEEQKHWLVLGPCPFQGHWKPILQLGTILNSKSFAITVADTKFISPNPSNYPSFDFLLIVGGFISSNSSFGDLLASILLLHHNSKAPFQQCSTPLMEQEKARAEVISCILHDKITYFSKAVSAWSFSAAQYNSRKAIPQQGMYPV